ncbi:MAG: hypothetical protein OJF50_006424 [Nitrospira sp.]|nr:hypothetical protein [Nitrospira sp.]
MLPDVDEPSSVIGQRLWVLAFWMKYCFGYRTISHSLVSVTVLSVCRLVLVLPPGLVAAFCVGWVSHVV